MVRTLPFDDKNEMGHVYFLSKRVWLHILAPSKRLRPWHDVSITAGVLFTRWFMFAFDHEWN